VSLFINKNFKKLLNYLSEKTQTYKKIRQEEEKIDIVNNVNTDPKVKIAEKEEDIEDYGKVIDDCLKIKSCLFNLTKLAKIFNKENCKKKFFIVIIVIIKLNHNQLFVQYFYLFIN